MIIDLEKAGSNIPEFVSIENVGNFQLLIRIGQTIRGVDGTISPRVGGVALLDAAGDYYLTLLANNTGMAGDQSLTLDLGSKSRTLRLIGVAATDISISDWFNQNVKDTAQPTYAGVILHGDSWHTLSGGGWPYGSFTSAGVEIAWTQAAASGTWYDISDADLVSGELNLCTQDSGQITVSKAGRYLINYSLTLEVHTANTHVESAISVNGTESTHGMAHQEGRTANTEYQLASTAILNLAALDTVNLSIRHVDAGTITLDVEMADLTLVQVGG